MIKSSDRYSTSLTSGHPRANLLPIAHIRFLIISQSGKHCCARVGMGGNRPIYMGNSNGYCIGDLRDVDITVEQFLRSNQMALYEHAVRGDVGRHL